MLVDHRITELAAGLRLLKDQPLKLRQRWRTRLLKAYALRQAAFRKAQAAHQAKLQKLQRTLLWVAGLSIGGSVLAILLSEFFGSFATLLFQGGVLGLGGSLLLWLYYGIVAAPRAPKHPLRKPLSRELFPPLYLWWRKGMQGGLAQRSHDVGVQGEVKLILALEARMGDRVFIIHRLQQTYGDDVDVVLVSASGIWVFEVKFWSGLIRWRQGQWSRQQSHYARGGVRVTERPTVHQPPDQQWRRMVADVRKTLRLHAPQLIQRHPAVTQIQGGLAFTCDNAQYDIPDSASFAWGRSAAWVNTCAAAPQIPGFTEAERLRVVDVLLRRHREVSGLTATRSMVDRARYVIDETEARLRTWIMESKDVYADS